MVYVLIISCSFRLLKQLYVLGEDVSMLITFNPQDINTCPDIKFLGPEKAVGPFLESLEKKLKVS